jgi:hypothetical protein
MNRERQAIMDKARAKRLRRRTSKGHSATENGSLAQSVKALAEKAVEKLGDLAGLAAQSIVGGVGGLDAVPAEPRTLPAR